MSDSLTKGGWFYITLEEISDSGWVSVRGDEHTAPPSLKYEGIPY